MDEDLNLGDFTRPHSFGLAKGPDAVRVTQKLKLRAKGRLARRKTRKLVVTVTAGARPVTGARVRLFGVGVKTTWKTSGRGGRVVFRLRPKSRGYVVLYASKRGYLAASSRIRVR